MFDEQLSMGLIYYKGKVMPLDDMDMGDRDYYYLVPKKVLEELLKKEKNNE